jgi:hypothetical protein
MEAASSPMILSFDGPKSGLLQHAVQENSGKWHNKMRARECDHASKKA